MNAIFVYRLDDVTAEMEPTRFLRFLDLFEFHGVRPLLGVIPDNQDPSLAHGKKDPAFWDRLRILGQKGLVDFAQHGHTHVYCGELGGLLGRKYGFSGKSEFTGLSEIVQREKIRAGRDLLRSHGILTDVWMAPSHGFDATTLRVAAELGFGAITDGIALWPFRQHGMVFVPQQLWEPKRVPFGLWTICLHTNTADERLYQAVEAHLRSGARVISFAEARALPTPHFSQTMNMAFRLAYRLHILRHRLRPSA